MVSGLGVGFTAGEGEVTATGEGGFVVSLLIEETGSNAARKNDSMKTGGVLTEIMDLGFWLLWGLVMIWVVLKVRFIFSRGVARDPWTTHRRFLDESSRLPGKGSRDLSE